MLESLFNKDAGLKTCKYCEYCEVLIAPNRANPHIFRFFRDYVQGTVVSNLKSYWKFRASTQHAERNF